MTNNTLIKLYSKDKKSLEQFKEFFRNISNKWKNTTFSIKNKKRKKQKTTLLKSPHVNKKAQTHFQSIVYSANLKCLTLNAKKNYIMLKKIKNHLFPDIKIKIEQTIFNKKTSVLKNDLFLTNKIYYYQEPKTFFNKQTQKKKLLTQDTKTEKKAIRLKKTVQFLKILDNYGNSY